jgi:hypothetical protein
MPNQLKNIVWIGSPRRDLKEFPEEVLLAFFCKQEETSDNQKAVSRLPS